VGKEFHLSALILILIFGVMINNKAIFFKGIFNRYINDETYSTILANIKLFVKDTAFVIRTFFFFFFGLSMAPDAFLNLGTYYGVTLSLVALYAIRYFNLKIFYHAKIFPVLFIAPRGLITVLLLFSIPEHLLKDQFEGDITFMVIIATNLIMMFALMRQNFRVKGDVPEISFNTDKEFLEKSDEENNVSPNLTKSDTD
jgi:NhaP-type Na+/H+ or K+/H+ antiporter